MADTNRAHIHGSHTHGPHVVTEPVEGDGVSYSGIGWFMIVLAITTVFCQVLVWGMLKFMQHRDGAADAGRAPLSAPMGQLPPGPNLLRDEPGNLREFRTKENEVLTTYAIDKMTGAVRIPVDRAKALILERGLPVRTVAPGAGADRVTPPTGKTTDKTAPAGAKTETSTPAPAPARGATQKGGR